MTQIEESTEDNKKSIAFSAADGIDLDLPGGDAFTDAAKEQERGSNSDLPSSRDGSSKALSISSSRKLGGSNRRVSVYANLNLSNAPSVQIRLYAPPRQRQKWGSDQILPHVNWGDLFFDLFYVAAFYNLGNILVDNPSPLGILYFVGGFLTVIGYWNQKLIYDSQFSSGDDICHKIFEVAVLVVLATNVSSIATVSRMSNPSKYVDMFSFTLSQTILLLLNCARYVECYFVGRGQRKNIQYVATNYIQFQVIPFIFFLAATIVSGLAYFGKDDEDTYDYTDDYRRGLAGGEGEISSCDYSSTTHVPIILLLVGYGLFALAYIVRVVCLFPADGSHKVKTIPINIDFVIHRNGELAMLVLGESILSLLIVDSEQGNYHSTFYFGILSVVVLMLLHFQSQPHDADSHAMRRSKNSGVLFGQTYPIYCAALVAVGASFKLIMYSVSKDEKRRLLSDLTGVLSEESLNRWLAGGGGDSGCSPYGDEKKQMVANLFSAAMAIVFVCMDIMQFAHVGLKKNVESCKIYGSCPVTGQTKMQYNFKGLFFVALPRVAITVFVGTLSLWETSPRILSALGFAAVTSQLITRFLGKVWFPETDVQSERHAHHHDGISDDEEPSMAFERQFHDP